MTDPAELNKWYFPFERAEDGSTKTEILGQERKTEVVEFEPNRAVGMVIHDGPVKMIGRGYRGARARVTREDP